MKKTVQFTLQTIALFCFFLITLASCSSKRSSKPTILVFYKTGGYYHESIPTGVKAIQDLGDKNGFDVDTTTNANKFAEDSLKKYAAIVFLSSTGEILSGNQEIAVERYMQAGGGFVGIHAATDAEYDWNWYVKMIGGSFKSHPANQEATLIINDKNHPSTDSLPATWTRTDEWYNFKNLNPDYSYYLYNHKFKTISV